MSKRVRNIIISAFLAIVLFLVLVILLKPGEMDKIEYVGVVKMTEKIIADNKIDKEQLKVVKMQKELAVGLATEIDQVANKYAKDNLYEGQYVRIDNLKNTNDSVKEDEFTREIMVITDLASYGGVGSGDKVDLTYVGTLNGTNNLGKRMYQGLVVEKVLNNEGIDLSTVQLGKYNKTELEPGFIIFKLPADRVLELQTLQGSDKRVCFKISKWTEKSGMIDLEKSIKTREDILFNNQLPQELHDELGEINENIKLVEEVEEGAVNEN